MKPIRFITLAMLFLVPRLCLGTHCLRGSASPEGGTMSRTRYRLFEEESPYFLFVVSSCSRVNSTVAIASPHRKEFTPHPNYTRFTKTRATLGMHG